MHTVSRPVRRLCRNPDGLPQKFGQEATETKGVPRLSMQPCEGMQKALFAKKRKGLLKVVGFYIIFSGDCAGMSEHPVCLHGVAGSDAAAAPAGSGRPGHHGHDSRCGMEPAAEDVPGGQAAGRGPH